MRAKGQKNKKQKTQHQRDTSPHHASRLRHEVTSIDPLEWKHFLTVCFTVAEEWLQCVWPAAF